MAPPPQQTYYNYSNNYANPTYSGSSGVGSYPPTQSQYQPPQQWTTANYHKDDTDVQGESRRRYAACVWLYVCMYLCVYVCVFMCVCVCIYACMCVNVCDYACVIVCFLCA